MHKELLIAGSNRSVTIVHNILHLYTSAASDAHPSETQAAAKGRQQSLQKLWANIAGSGIQALMQFWTEALKATTLFAATQTTSTVTGTDANSGSGGDSECVSNNGGDGRSSISRSHDGLSFHSVGTDTLIAIVDATSSLLTGYLEKELELPYSVSGRSSSTQSESVEHPLAASAETTRAVVSVLSILVGPVLVRDESRPNGIGFYIPLGPGIYAQ